MYGHYINIGIQISLMERGAAFYMIVKDIFWRYIFEELKRRFKDILGQLKLIRGIVLNLWRLHLKKLHTVNNTCESLMYIAYTYSLLCFLNFVPMLEWWYCSGCDALAESICYYIGSPNKVTILR